MTPKAAPAEARTLELRDCRVFDKTGDADLVEAVANAILHRRIQSDWTLVVDGAWTIDHDKELALAALAPLHAAVQALIDAETERCVAAAKEWVASEDDRPIAAAIRSLKPCPAPEER